MTTCYICEINYKNEDALVGTFSEHAPSNRNKNRYLDRDVCINCVSIVRDKNLKLKEAEFIQCFHCLINYKPEMIKAFLKSDSDRLWIVNKPQPCCEKCLPIIWSNKAEISDLEKREKEINELKNELEILKNNLEASNEKLETKRDVFEQALDTAERWHKEQLGIKDKRISELEFSLQEKDLKSLTLRVEFLENAK